MANDGPSAVQYVVRMPGCTAHFTQGEIVFLSTDRVVRVQFEGSNPSVEVVPAGVLPGTANILIGDKAEWRRDVPIYGGIVYRGLYQGIDLVYASNGRNLLSKFIISREADPAQIQMRIRGAGELRSGNRGGLILPTRRVEAPDIHQIRAGWRQALKAKFVVGSSGNLAFDVGQYDAGYELTIDASSLFSTFLGGSGSDAALSLAVDASGSAYVAGFTTSLDFPTGNAEQNFNAGSNDAFIAKLDASGNALVYATYIGGMGDDRASGIAVDSSGSVYITGWTGSRDFPLRRPLQSHLAGARNAFILKLNPAGNGLVFSTYLGGSGSDSGNGIAVDSAGAPYIVGDTTSINFPANGLQKSNRGGQDAFVAKLSPDGSTLLYTTYLGGAYTDHGANIAVDAQGSAYITGSTNSMDFPVANAYQTTNGGAQVAFVARLSSDGNTVLFSTYLGGGGIVYPEGGMGIALDGLGNAYITGVTSSAGFPLRQPLQSSIHGTTDCFVTKMDAFGQLVYSTYLGGSGVDFGNAIAVDTVGNTYVVGYTNSSDLPVTSNASQLTNRGDYDAFVAVLNASGDRLVYLSYFGGSASDTATAVALNASNQVYVAGWTLSTNFPLVSPYQSVNAGNYGAFVMRLSALSPVSATINSPAPGLTFTGTTVTFTWNGVAGADIYWLDVGTAVAQGNICASATVALQATCSGIPATGSPIFVQLWTHYGGVWQTPNRYSYTGALLDTRAQLTSPQTNVSGPTMTFTWNAIAGGDQYWLDVGNAVGSGNFCAISTAGTQATCPNIPVTYQITTPTAGAQLSPMSTFCWLGRQTYVQLWTHMPGIGWQTPQRYTLGPPNADYWLDVGTMVGQGNLVAGVVSGTTCRVVSVPNVQSNIYVQLWTRIPPGSGTWYGPIQYTYLHP